MATQTQTVVREEEKDLANLASMLTEFNDRMTQLDQREATDSPPTANDWWTLFRWVINQVADAVHLIGTGVSIYKSAKAMVRNTANAEALLNYLLNAIGGLESFFLGSYRISRRMFNRGHFVRRYLQKLWFYFRDCAPTAETADKILGGLQILGAAVGLAMALKNLANIRRLNTAIQQSETDLQEWEKKWKSLLNARLDAAQDAVVDLMEYFDAITDFTNSETQLTLHRLMRNAQHRSSQYKEAIGNATAELRKIELTAREHRVQARANRNASTSAVMGGLATVATAAMGPGGTIAKFVGGLGAATTVAGATGLVLSQQQLTRIDGLLQRVGRNMDELDGHRDSYDGIVESLENFAKDFEGKIKETKSTMERLREAEAAKDAQLAAQQAELEAMRRLLAQMNMTGAPKAE